MMRFLFLFLLYSLPLVSVAQSKSDQAVLSAEQRRFEAMMHRDTLALRGMVADDLVYTHSNAVTENKTQHIGAIAAGRMVYGNMVREQATVRRSAKMALINGIVRVNGSVNGTSFEVRLIYTAVYRKKHGHWLLINWQSTRIV